MRLVTNMVLPSHDRIYHWVLVKAKAVVSKRAKRLPGEHDGKRKMNVCSEIVCVCPHLCQPLDVHARAQVVGVNVRVRVRVGGVQGEEARGALDVGDEADGASDRAA